MKFKNLNTKDRQALDSICLKASETWAKNVQFHPTIDTYHEAFTRGAKAALSLPVPDLQSVATWVASLTLEGKDMEWTLRAWKALMNGDSETVEDALKLTEKVEPPSGPAEKGKTPPAGPQELSEPDKETE